MKLAQPTIADGLDALSSIEEGRPYSLRLEDPKRRLADAVAASVQGLGIRPLVIGGLAVSHHGYLRVSLDLDLLVAKDEAVALRKRLRSSPEFKDLGPGLSIDIYVEGERTAPGSAERFPRPDQLDSVDTRPLPVPSLADLIALKVMSGLARDDADVVELLKRHRSRIPALRRKAARRLRTADARERLQALTHRARAELARRRRLPRT